MERENEEDGKGREGRKGELSKGREGRKGELSTLNTAEVNHLAS